MPTLITLRTEPASGRIQIHSPFSYKDTCKALPGARWSKRNRCWSIPATPHAAQAALEVFGPAVAEPDKLTMELAALAGVGEGLKGLDSKDLPAIPLVRTEPWSNQVLGFHLMKDQPATFLAWEMGTGKTKPVVDLIVNLGLRKILVVCPNSVVPVWPSEFRKHAARQVEVLALSGWQYGSVKDRAEKAEEALDEADRRGRPLVLVVNYEAAWRSKLKELFLEEVWDLVVADEIHRIKAPAGKASRFMQLLGHRARKRVGLSGTPMPHSPLDVYAQFRFLDEGIFGTSFVRFRACYAVMGGYEGHQVLSFQRQDEMHRLFYSIAHRVTKDEILDLPEQIHKTVPIALCPNARRIYDELDEEFIADVGSGVVTASNALSRLLRLQQITSGWAHVEGDRDLPRGKSLVKVDESKRRALVDLLGDLPEDEPVLVFCRFHVDLDAVLEIAGGPLDEDGDGEGAELSGRRRDIGARWEDHQGRIAAVQIQAGGLGVDLTRACHVVFFSLGFSLGDYEQALSRPHRAGQTRHVTYYHFVATDTVDEKVYAALQARQRVIQRILREIQEDKNGA